MNQYSIYVWVGGCLLHEIDFDAVSDADAAVMAIGLMSDESKPMMCFKKTLIMEWDPEARMQGRAAASHDERHSVKTECPFQKGSYSAREWLNGYQEDE